MNNIKTHPLEPREIEIEKFQQLHMIGSQEELQEFLLLESQCSVDLGKINLDSDYRKDSGDKPEIMSGIFLFTLTI